MSYPLWAIQANSRRRFAIGLEGVTRKHWTSASKLASVTPCQTLAVGVEVYLGSVFTYSRAWNFDEIDRGGEVRVEVEDGVMTMLMSGAPVIQNRWGYNSQQSYLVLL